MNKLFEVEFRLFDGSAPQRRVTDATVHIDAGMTHGTKEFMHGMQTARKVEAGEGTWKVGGMMFHLDDSWTLRVNVVAGGKTSTADLLRRVVALDETKIRHAWHPHSLAQHCQSNHGRVGQQPKKPWPCFPLVGKRVRHISRRTERFPGSPH
jgi:hypothetical protein